MNDVERFTKEDAPAEPPLGRAPPRLAPGEVRYITPEGQRAFVEEATRLEHANADDPRAKLLRATLAVVTVLAPQSTDRASFGAWVTVEDEDGEVRTYRLVGPDEGDAKTGAVSVASPLARALLGTQEGDTVTFDRPRGRAQWTVVRVRSTPS